MAKKTVNQKRDTGELDKKQLQILKLVQANNAFGIFLGAGSGKSRIVIRHMLGILKKNKRVNALIVSTKANTLDTWPNQLQEQMKLTNTNVTYHVLHKEYKQALKPGSNCQYSARVIICNYESLRQLLWHYEYNDGKGYFDFLIVDESIRIKNWRAKATAILFTFAEQCKYRYPLSGRPTPNKIVDLFTQVYLIDFGKRLGHNITAFRREYMEQGFGNRFVWNTKGFPNEGRMKHTEDQILAKVADICVTEETETFVKNLTKARYHTEYFELSKPQRERYLDFEKNALLELEKKKKDIAKRKRKEARLIAINIKRRKQGKKLKKIKKRENELSVSAATGLVLRMKLLQYVSGNIYSDPLDEGSKEVIRTNKRRMDALDKWMVREYKPGSKLIIAYGFKHSVPDILLIASRHTPRHKILVVEPRKKGIIGMITREWNANRCDILIGHAASIGHGLNLQKHGGQVFFYSLTDNFDHYYQLARRILRRGNPKKYCDITVLACKDTADQLVVDNIVAKAELGKRVMSAVNILKALTLMRKRLS